MFVNLAITFLSSPPLFSQNTKIVLRNIKIFNKKQYISGFYFTGIWPMISVYCLIKFTLLVAGFSLVLMYQHQVFSVGFCCNWLRKGIDQKFLYTIILWCGVYMSSKRDKLHGVYEWLSMLSSTSLVGRVEV